MKKFFTLCLAFMLASLLNVNAADTYTLVGADINGASWDTQATQNDFVYDESTGIYTLTGAKVNGEFKIVKNHAWGDGELVANPYGVKVPVNTAYRMYYNNQDGCTSNLNSNGELTNCTVKLQFVGTNNDPYVTIETESTQSWSWSDDVCTNWGIIGADAILGAWGPDVDLTCNWNSTYTWKTTTLPTGEFKFRENDDWGKNFGAGISSTIDVNSEVSLGYNTGNIKFNTPSEDYALYEFTLTIRGGAAKLKVVGYKDVTPSTTTALIDLTAQNYTNAQEVTSVSDPSNTITATFDKGTNSSTPKWYDSGSAVRLYGGGSLTVSAPAGKIITGVSFTFGSSDKTNEITADSGTFDGTSWSGSANSVKFSVGGTKDHRRFAKINVTYGTEGATEYPDWLASLNLSDGGVYYYDAQYTVTNNNADSFVVEVTDAATGNVVSSDSNYNGTLYAGEWIVKLITYKGTEMCSTTYSVKVEAAELAWSLSEFIGKEGYVKYVRNTAYVTYQNGPNLYLKDGSGAMLVYSYSLPTFQSGDMFDSFVGSYEDYNGTNEIIPVESTFNSIGNWGAQEPEVITLDQVTAANQNKYVKLENVAIDYANKKIGTATLYDKFKVEGLASVDATKKYDVIGIIGAYNGEGQIYPISWEALPVVALNPQTIEPAEGEVESLNTITLTFAEKTSINAETEEVITLKCDSDPDYNYGKDLTVTMSEDGLTATITSTPSYSSWTVGKTYSLEVPAGYFTAIGAASEALKYSWTITSPKIRYSEVTPAQGSEVYELSEVVLTFPKNVYGLNFSPLPSVNILDVEGNVVTTVNTAYGDSKNILKIAIDPAITTPGTYSIVLAADKLGDDQFYGGNHNAEIVLNYTVIENPLKLDLIPYATVPTAGTEVDALTKVTLWFPDDATPSDMSWNITEKPSVVDQDGNTYTASIDYTSYTEAYYVYINDVTNPGTYTLTIPQGTFGDDDYFNTKPYNTIGRTNPELTYTWTIKAAPIAPTAVDPADGAEVSDLNTTVITFAEAVTVNAEVGAITLVRDSDPGYDKQDAVVTISEDGLTATITCKPVYPTYEPKWYTGETYTMSIPAGYFVVASGATNEALSYSWKIAAAKFTFVDVTPAQGEVTELSEILIGFAQKTYFTAYINPTFNLTDAEGNVVTTATTVRAQNANGDWYAIKATLKDKVTAPGTYTLVVPADELRDESSTTTNAAFDLTFTIVEPDPNTYTLALNVDPADGSTVTALDKIVFTQGTGVIAIFQGSDDALTDNWCTVTDANGVTYNNKLALETGTSGYGLTIEGATAAGTYTVVVPAKTFVDAMTMSADSKNYNAEMTLTYTVDSNTYDFAWTVDPAEGEVEELTTLVFTAATAGQIAMPTNQAKSDNWVKVVDANGNVYNTTAIAGTGYDVTIEGATAAGTYTVTVPKGSFYDMTASLNGTMNFNDEIVLTYTIKAAEVVEDFTPVVTPVAGNITVDQMDVTVITVDSPIASFDDSNLRYIKAAGGNVWFFGSYTISEDKLSITINWDLVKGNYPVGTSYTLELPAGCIVLENGAKNLLTHVDYTLIEPDPYTYTYGISEISPAEGIVTELGNQIFITATGDWFEFTPTAYTTTNWIKLVDDKGKTYTTGVGYVTDTQAVVYVMNDENTESLVITEPGTYTMTIPQGTFGDRTFYESSNEKGNLNPELVYTWTIEAPADFTPEVNPIAGEVTKEEIKTTVITFPSPIASFDGSNVGLIYYQFEMPKGPWYDYAATGTISEDKLSMTIVWDFAPEVGLTYTLELPAGCIVLENGAKNLETNVAYTVVAGPKDLAEFTVPAGIVGWLNYDASDVNAWAPEFPFTVSTSQNNTISFAATLPSLPTGVTAMEVVNDNNEVIATLNQTGVAPLAEGGEEYQVAGETTNEYVEGSELRFRFRFSHAGGTSETILFSYIVAGGTITGADAIELDGNVIVRGNEIIAPQGSAIYTISGIQVPAEGLAPGVYVVVYGNQAVKVMVK